MQKIIGFTMITDPDFRQDPWKESIRQALEVFDSVVVVYGKKEDAVLLFNEFALAIDAGKLRGYFMHWSQPEWSYRELPLHLNFALAKAWENGADWAVRFDSDCFFHERDKNNIRTKLAFLSACGKKAAYFEKLQFFLTDTAYEKGPMPLALKRGSGIVYGRAEAYNDLCQPIVPRDAEEGGVPTGTLISTRICGRTGIHVWNYDYTFKTKERAQELLFRIDKAHARYWGHSYEPKRVLEEITVGNSYAAHMAMVAGKVARCNKNFRAEDHPKHIQEKIKNITLDQFGHSLWGEIPRP